MAGPIQALSSSCCYFILLFNRSMFMRTFFVDDFYKLLGSNQGGVLVGNS